MDLLELPGHVSVQLDPPPQDTEHWPVHVTLQFALLEQDTLPEFPTVMVQLAPLQSMLHESWHVPAQDWPELQLSEQLLPLGSQPLAPA